MLFIYDIFDLLRVEICIDIPFHQMPSQFLRVLLKLLFVFFYSAVQGQERVISFFLVEFLGEKGYNVDIGFLLHLHDQIIDF
jgi:hypothetical protein